MILLTPQFREANKNNIHQSIKESLIQTKHENDDLGGHQLHRSDNGLFHFTTEGCIGLLVLRSQIIIPGCLCEGYFLPDQKNRGICLFKKESTKNKDREIEDGSPPECPSPCRVLCNEPTN